MDTMGDPFEHGMRRSRVDPDKESAARAVMERSGIIASKPIDPNAMLMPRAIPGSRESPPMFVLGVALLIALVGMVVAAFS